jgi:hypothetical protein
MRELFLEERNNVLIMKESVHKNRSITFTYKKKEYERVVLYVGIHIRTVSVNLISTTITGEGIFFYRVHLMKNIQLTDNVCGIYPKIDRDLKREYLKVIKERKY